MDQLCTLCFRNFGVRREAELVAGGPVSSPCPNCKLIGGGFLDRGVCEQLLHRFFVEGSIPPEAGGHAPVYEFNPHHLHGEVLFATELDSDLELLSRFLGVGLFHYGPPLWRFGHTDHYSALKGNMEDGTATQGEARKAIWEEVIARCSIKTLEPGMSIFRVRRGQQLPPAIPAEFDTPPPGLASEGRYDSAERPVFYGAEDVETCLHESRVTLSDYIALATFTPTRPLRLLDLADNIDDSSARTPFEQVDVFMKRLAFAGKQDYDLCRELAAEIEERGFDGFLFISYFAQAHRQKLRNIALHGHPVQSGKLQLVSVNRIRLAETNYKYSFGPHNDTSLPIEPTAIEELSARMMAGTISFQEASAEFKRLLNRRSEGPR